MIMLGLKRTTLDKLVLPGNFRSLAKEDRIAELAASIAQNGLINPPLVRKSDRKVICGIDRIAAMKKLGRERFDVELCECTDREAELAEIAENLHRRKMDADETKRLRARYVELAAEVAAQSAEPRHDQPAARKPGRQKSEKREARQKAAKALGVSEETVRRAEKSQEPPVSPAAPVPPVDMRGLGVKYVSAHGAEIRLFGELFEHADQTLRRLQSLFTEHEPKLNFLKKKIDLNAYKQRLAAVAAVIRADKPDAVCLYCKLLPDVMPNCAACRGAGYLIKSQLADIPKELHATGTEAGIFFGGKFRRLFE